MPERLLDRSLPAPGLLAHIVVGKYCDHLPLYRQEQIYQQRHGVHLPRQSLARWVELAADWLKPIYEQIRTGVMGGGYVQVDETPVDYLEPGNGKTKQGYLWTCSRPGGDVFYRWETSRAAACLDNIIPVDFTGTVQCDGYSAYRSFANGRNGAIELAGCWAHVRRKFHEALEQSPKTAGWIMRQIQHLYRVEARLREQRAGPRLREAVRAHRKQAHRRSAWNAPWSGSRAAADICRKVCLGIAIDYALGQWPTLDVYLDDGRVEIDNNLVENAIRPTALGKKNWLFMGEAGGRRTRRHHLHRHRKLPPPRHRSLRLPQRRADPPAQHDQPPNPRSHAPEPGPKRSCKFNGKPHHNSHNYHIYESFSTLLVNRHSAYRLRLKADSSDCS